MAYRKIFLAVDCNSDQEVEAVQQIAKEVSETFRMSAKDLIAFYPFLRQHKALLYSAVKTVSKEGKKGVMKLIPMLIKQL